MTQQAARALDQLIEAGSGHLDFSALVHVAAGDRQTGDSLPS
jgi:hypothetical protein